MKNHVAMMVISCLAMGATIRCASPPPDQLNALQGAVASSKFRNRDDIGREVRAQIEQLARRPGHEQLTRLGKQWEVEDILFVTSLIDADSYHVVHIRSAEVVATVLLDNGGNVGSYHVGAAQGDAMMARPLTLEAAVTAVKGKMLRMAPVDQTRYVHTSGTVEPGGSRFVPLVQVRSADGDYYVNSSRQVFRANQTVDMSEINTYQQRFLAIENGRALLCTEIDGAR